MKFIINYNGDYDDSIIIEGDTIEEVREVAFLECDRRGWEKEHCSSQRVEE